MKKPVLNPGDVVQLAPEARNPMFACCMMTVTEPKEFGARAYYRATWEEMEFVGSAQWWVA